MYAFYMLFFMDLLQGNLLAERLVVFIVATTGQGDPPENMKVRDWSQHVHG